MVTRTKAYPVEVSQDVIEAMLELNELKTQRAGLEKQILAKTKQIGAWLTEMLLPEVVKDQYDEIVTGN